MVKNYKKITFAFIIVAILIIIVGSSIAWFNYTGTSTNQELLAGDIRMQLIEGNNSISLTNVLPETPEEARERDDNYITFSIQGLNTSSKTIYYEIKLNYDTDEASPKERFRDSELRFDLVELDDNNNEVNYVLSSKSFSTINNKRIWVDTIAAGTSSTATKRYKLRVWVSDSVTVSDTDEATYTTNEFKNRYANVKVSAYGDLQEKEIDSGINKVKAAIAAKIDANPTALCNPVWVDDMGTANDTSDDVTYFSGNNTCVDMNYVWYSGKLWRITAIYPNGTMKLVTENALTAIQWGSPVEYNGSWIYQWLNEDFYDTLFNPTDFLETNSMWNYSTDASSTPVRPETIEPQATISAPVGLLNAYEYYNSFPGASVTPSYLNIGYYWWLITPKDSSYVRCVNDSGYLSSYGPDLFANSYGVRPAIILKYSVDFTGDGTLNSPYKIIGDKENPVNNSTLLSSRSVGEYVKFDNDIYRIVSINEAIGTTKLTMVDVIRDNGDSVSKKFASTVYFGKNSNTQTDTYWDYYLNNTWYNSISITYKNMLIDSTYYMGLYQNNTSYKAILCKDYVPSEFVTTKNCTKYTSSDANKTFTGKVGLPRVGEMFSAQLDSNNVIWTVTLYTTSDVSVIYANGKIYYYAPSVTSSVRPSINLKSGIKITGGTGYVGGETNSPFEISE